MSFFVLRLLLQVIWLLLLSISTIASSPSSTTLSTQSKNIRRRPPQQQPAVRLAMIYKKNIQQILQIRQQHKHKQEKLVSLCYIAFVTNEFNYRRQYINNPPLVAKNRKGIIKTFIQRRTTRMNKQTRENQIKIPSDYCFFFRLLCCQTSTTTCSSSSSEEETINCTNTLIVPNGITLKIAVDANGGVAELCSVDVEDEQNNCSIIRHTTTTAAAAATTATTNNNNSNNSKRFTCNESLDMVHRLRCVSDAVLIGKSTVTIDNPSLTIRRGVVCNRKQQPQPQNEQNQNLPIDSSSSSSSTSTPFQPLRVVLDPQLSLFQSTTNCTNNENHMYERITPNYTIFNDGLPTLVYYSQDLRRESILFSSKLDSVTLIPIPVINNKNNTHSSPTSTSATTITNSSSTISSSGATVLDLHAIVHDLYQNWNVRHLMVEGGPTTAKQFLQSKLVDRCIFVHAPTVQFIKPFNSGLVENNYTYLRDIGSLVHIGTRSFGVDRMEYWCKSSSSLSSSSTLNETTATKWPTAELSDWP